MSPLPAPVPSDSSTTERAQRSRRWRLAVIVGAILVTGGAGAAYWRLSASRVALVLPASPDLQGWPEVFQQKLRAAQKAAATPGRPLSAVVTLARLYQANGFVAEAETCWRWLHATQPREPKWVYYLADGQRMMGDPDQIRTLLQQTLQLAPDYAPAWLQLADLDFKAGRVDDAERGYERRLALVPGDPYARLGLARIAQQRNQQERARQMIEQLVHDAPHFPTGRNLYAQMLQDSGDIEGAKQQRILAAGSRFREADDPWIEDLRSDCYDTKRLSVLATIEFQTQHGDRGRGYIERALQIAPADRDVILLAGNQYLKLNEPAKAREILERGFKVLQPPPMMLYFELCEALRLLNQSDAALRLVQQGLVQLPQSFELHNECGAILGDLGQLPESAAEYRKALAIAPDDTDSNYSLGITLLALKQRREAIDYIKRSLRLEPAYPRALIMLGRLDLEDGQLDHAAGYIRLLYDLHPEQQQARQLMAAWHLRAGLAAAARHDAVAAAQQYREGYGIDPQNPELCVNLGVSCLIQGQPAQALAPFEAYRRLEPGDPQGALFLGQTYAQVGRLDDARRTLREGEDLAVKAGAKETAAHCREILSQLQ